jgi:hypothetical protein
MIRIETAKKICSSWHGGQWSALYQFASSGVFVPDNALRYVWEIMQDLQNQHFAPYPHDLKKGETKELTQLKEYFEGLILANIGLKVEYIKHSQYGYLYPSLPNYSINLPI